VPFESAQVVSTNCTDADAGQSLTSVVDSAPTHGGLNALSSDGTFTYTPYAGYTGQDSFTYHATDGYGGSSSVKTVTLYVATDAPPTCAAKTVAVKHATAVAVPLSCTDPDTSQTLTLAIGTPPAHGSLANLSSTQVTYRPNASFGGTDTFTYTASDGHGGTATPAKVTLKVAPGATALSLAARKLTIQVGDKDRLTARLRDVVTGRYVNSQKVLLQSRASKTGSWRTVTSTTTKRVGTKAGTAVFTVKPARSRYYRVVYRGTAALLASRSTAVHVTVKR
jgi:VCBS repeat-containing protein